MHHSARRSGPLRERVLACVWIVLVTASWLAWENVIVTISAAIVLAGLFEVACLRASTNQDHMLQNPDRK